MGLVERVERAMKAVADAGKKDEEAFKNGLVGVARVGEVAKGLLIKGDRAANLILLCRDKPTTGQLEQLHAAMVEELGKVS